MDEDAEVFVITEVLKSNSITVLGLADSGTQVSIDVPAVQEAVGAKVTIETRGSRDTEVTYQGQTFLTFGFKAFGIAFNDGEWQVQGTKIGEEMAFAPPGVSPQDVRPVLLSKGGLLTLK